MRHVLFIDENQEACELFCNIIKPLGYIVITCSNARDALKLLSSKKIDIVFCEMNMSKKNGIELMKMYEQKVLVSGQKAIPWVFVTRELGHVAIEKALMDGATYFLLKPFSKKAIVAIFSEVRTIAENPFLEIGYIVEKTSGVKFDKSKQKLIETRINRRISDLKLSGLSGYLSYFKGHRAIEFDQIVSVLTTHTTKFFREEAHYDYLFDVLFPLLIKQNAGVRVWSAACSTGEELYSLVICFLEFCRFNRINVNNIPKLTFIGSDIDIYSVEKARRGIYKREIMGNIPDQILSKYFTLIEDNNEVSWKVNRTIREMCSFSKINLQKTSYGVDGLFDIIFVRNVFIYFNQDDIEKISNKLSSCLSDHGRLFLGHSETLRGLDVSCEQELPAIYKKKIEITSPQQIEKRKKPKKKNKIKVLIVDDLKTIQVILKRIISSDEHLEVAGVANNPIEAIEFLKKNTIDVMTLDIHMPEMDGITYLKSCDKIHPPVIMISAASESDAREILNLEKSAAFDYIQKPTALSMSDVSAHIVSSIKAAAKSRNKRTTKKTSKKTGKLSPSRSELILIGASTGGISAVETILLKIPKESPPILIVQHIPSGFSKAFAERLNKICSITVSEAIDGELVMPGHAYVAPGGVHMKIRHVKDELCIKLTDEEKVNRFKPSVDTLFHSVGNYVMGKKIIGILLTGMGNDGALGLLALKNAGALTFAESEESCVVFGMPKKAIELGAASHVLTQNEIAQELIEVKMGLSLLS